jgi:Tfp pilus assembly protein PilF
LKAALRACLFVSTFLLGGKLCAQTPATAAKAESQLLTVEGRVQIFAVTGTNWASARTNQILHLGDRVRTGERSRATIRLSDLSILRVNELTTLQIREPQQAGKGTLLDFEAGTGYFFSREKPAKQEFRTPLTSGAIRGTEFNVAVAEDGRTVVALIDGEVTLSNQLGKVEMASGDQGLVEAGKAPVKSPMLEAINIIQWCLYYPGVLDPDELELSSADRETLAGSLAAYRNGDLLQAVSQYPTNRAAGSDGERVYRAATLLSAGQAEQAEGLLKEIQTNNAAGARNAQLAVALREIVAVVKNRPAQGARTESGAPRLATESLAESYYFQSQGKLSEALSAARAAVEKSPKFGFGWARVAELELSFGRLSSAMAAVEKSLQVSPRNGQSLAVKGFILLAQERPGAAETAFNEAIALDGALGNAWLGRGLCQIRRGHAEAGRQNLHVAAVLEPQRAVLRSYLGKAFSNAGDNQRAEKELALARRFDPNDPTSWLYSALVEQQENQVNDAIGDLEKSKELNENRRLFRSKLLLDEDQAVRGANLASVYQDAGIFTWNKNVAVSDWSVREASRAVNYDYANYSAHQFLANSYDALRDPRQINLRYETPWFSELLMANLLSPVGAGNLSDYSSQKEDSRLFEQNHLGFSSDTEYLSHGDWLQRGSQFGTWGPVSYAADVEYRNERGWRANNDLEQFTGSLKGKAQLTPQDSILLEGIYYHSKFGDEAQYYHQYGSTNAGIGAPSPSTTFRGEEKQEPNVFLGYHHEWEPGLHTLFLGGHLDDTLHYTDPHAIIPFTRHVGTNITFVRGDPFSVRYERQFEAYTAELQQIWQTAVHTMVLGGRYQDGWNTTFNQVDNSNNVPSLISRTNAQTELERYGVYFYETLKPWEPLELTGGVSYDHLHYPFNIDTSPITTREGDIDQVSPKAGAIWTPMEDTHLRFAYTRSLGGVFYDTSVRLEPSQVAGFNQAYRSIIPESVVGLVPGTRFTTYGVGLDQAFKTHTYLTVAGEILDSEAIRTVGVITNRFFIPVANSPGSTRQSLDFTEKSLIVNLTQLLGQQWSLGARYQFSEAELTGRFVDIPKPASNSVNQDQKAWLHQVALYANYYHPCGFFSQAQALWFTQDNHGYSPHLPSEDFWQLNFYVGYRFLSRAAEVKLGLLNITDQDYRLNPLNLYYDLPRERTLSVSCKFYF